MQAPVVDDQREVRADVLLVEAGDIALFDFDVDVAGSRLRPCLVDRLGDEVDSGDLPTVLGQIDGVVAGSTAEVEGPARSQRRTVTIAFDQVRQALRQRITIPRNEAEPVEGLEEQMP